MKFEKTYFSKEGRYWIGKESDSSRYYLGIPISNTMVDYIEFYWIDDGKYQRFLDDQGAAFEFAEACRRHEHDDLVVYKPGNDRGTRR